MENLSLLNKIYNCGETLSNEDLNLLITFINRIINYLNNTVNVFMLNYSLEGNNGLSGRDGRDGRDGVDGQDGLDGITPLLRINQTTNYWEVSYNNGNTWTSLGVKATGENGTNGTNGLDGANGDTWTIGNDGYWYKNGVITLYKAVGTDGLNGTNGTNGTNGVDGHTPVITINSDGFWCVDGVSTGVSARCNCENNNENLGGGEGNEGGNDTPATVNVPTISGITPFENSTYITITNNENGARIYYTVNGTNPTSSSTEYSSAFNIFGTTTVKAIAIKENNSSSIVSRIFIKLEEDPTDNSDETSDDTLRGLDDFILDVDQLS